MRRELLGATPPWPLEPFEQIAGTGKTAPASSVTGSGGHEILHLLDKSRGLMIYSSGTRHPELLITLNSRYLQAMAWPAGLMMCL